MPTSRALCSRSASCLSPITVSRQRRLSAAFLTAIPEASRQVHDDAFANAFNSRKPSGFAPPPDSAPSQTPKDPSKRPRNSRFAPQYAGADDESAIDIFNSVVRRRKKDDIASDDRVADFSLTAILRRVAKRDMAPRKRVDFFFKDVWPSVMEQGRPLPKGLLREVNAALRSVSNALLGEPGFKQVRYGDLTNIANAYQWLGTNDVAAISGLITGLCFLIVKQPTSRASKMSNSGQAAMSPANARNPELIRLWACLSHMNRADSHLQSEEERLELKLPSLDEVIRITKNLERPENAEVALTAILNQFPVNTSKQVFPALMATLTILFHYAPAASLPQWAPLLDPARHILTEFPIEETLLRQRFAENILIPPISQGVLARAVASRWEGTCQRLTLEHPLWHATTGRRTAAASRPSHMKLARLYRELRAAHESHNTGVLVGLWREMQSHLERGDAALADEMRQTPEYLNYWHFVWCASKHSHMISEVQQLMQKLGLEPTIKTYTSMMHGWKMSRQTERINMLWDTLRNAGYQLDSYMWTERISGLIECGEPQRGINTLAEMLAIWKQAVEEGRSDTAVPVTITVINAAFKPLIHKDRQAAFKVLQWAGSEGIKPDVFTYNILLRECFRGSQSSSDVTNLLTAMKNEGIEPNGATFTIVLEGACRNLHHASAEEQVVAVNQVIQDMRTADVPLNLEVWGKLLHTVTGLSSGSDAAINCVLQHSREAGFKQISPHMVHILINRVMESRYRKAEAVEKILLENGFQDVTTGDQRLWEEVISAYSTLGDPQRAMAVYKDLRGIGRKMERQFASRNLLAVLLDNGDKESAKMVVDDALVDIHAEDHHSDRFFKHNFWHRAYEERLLDWDKAPPALKKAVDPRRAAPKASEGFDM